MVEVTFMPTANMNAGTGAFGYFTTVVDYDDATALTLPAQALDYSNALSGEGYQAQRRVFKPHVAIAAYSGAFTSFANEESPWIDNISSGVQHYGVKTAWTVTAALQHMDVNVRMWLQFRNVR